MSFALLLRQNLTLNAQFGLQHVVNQGNIYQSKTRMISHYDFPNPVAKFILVQCYFFDFLIQQAALSSLRYNDWGANT